MCGRYYVDDSMIGKIERTLSGLDNRLNGKTFSGDIYPTNTAPVISAAADHLLLEKTRWGYPGPAGKGILINARSETVRDKRIWLIRQLEPRIIQLLYQAKIHQQHISAVIQTAGRMLM